MFILERDFSLIVVEKIFSFLCLKVFDSIKIEHHVYYMNIRLFDFNIEVKKKNEKKSQLDQKFSIQKSSSYNINM